VKRVTQTHESRCYHTGNCKLAPLSLATHHTTISVDLADDRVVKTAEVQHDYVITMRRRPSWLHKHIDSGHDLNLSVVSSIVCNVGTNKLVCNKQKSVLLECVLTILSYIEINRNSAGTRKSLY